MAINGENFNGDVIRKLLLEMIEDKEDVEFSEETYNKFEFLCNVVSKSVGGENTSIEMMYDEPYKGAANICIEGRDIVITNPKLFYCVTLKAFAIEITPLVNGKTRIDIMVREGV